MVCTGCGFCYVHSSDFLPMIISNHRQVIVIGAGVSGLLCATLLKQHGFTVAVLEKSRGYGGRMATRRFAGGRADHGVQFFTVRDWRFQSFVDEWIEQGLCKRWFVGSGQELGAQGHLRLFCPDGMNAVGKHLAQELEVHLEQRVVALRHNENRWQVLTEDGKCWTSDFLVATAPLPQSIALLESTNLGIRTSDLQELKLVRYHRGLTLIARLEGTSGLPQPGFARPGIEPLMCVTDNRMKGISADCTIITAHATHHYADSHYDSPDSTRVPPMLDALNALLHTPVSEWECHRWGYAFPIQSSNNLFFHQKDLNLFLAGDGFGGPRVEGAALSGIQTASELIATQS
jgi:renalase